MHISAIMVLSLVEIQKKVKHRIRLTFYHFLMAVEGIDPVRREKLVELLDIDLQWRMHKVSDGQRRRVQICMGLLHPFQV